MEFGPYNPQFAAQQVFGALAQFINDIRDVIAPLVGAGLGAWFAFRLESKSREKKEGRRLLGVAKWELFRLATIWGWYQSFHKRTILHAELADVPGWQVKNSLKPSLSQQFTTPSAYEDLLAVGLNSATIMHLDLMIENYQQLQNNRAERKRVWNDQIVMTLQEAGVKNAERLTASATEDIVGHAMYTMYVNLGRQLIVGTRAGLEQASSQYQSTLQVIAARFPGEDFEAAILAYEIDVELEQLRAEAEKAQNEAEQEEHAPDDDKSPDLEA